MSRRSVLMKASFSKDLLNVKTDWLLLFSGCVLSALRWQKKQLKM